MNTGASLSIGIAFLVIAAGLVWFGRQYSYTRFMTNGLVFVTYPSIVLVFIAYGLALIISALY